jgi:hypothetical protein
VLPSDAPAAMERMNKVDEWKADLEACLAPAAAASAAAADGHIDAALPRLPSSIALESLETRYKELECIIPDHKRMEPLLRDYKRWRERHKPWSEFFTWCKAARAGCFLSGDGYNPSAAPLPASAAPPPASLKRIKSEEPLAALISTVSDRRRRSGIEVPPPSSPVIGKKGAKETLGKRGAEEEMDNTLYCHCICHVLKFCC